jgi:hypothetical protein
LSGTRATAPSSGSTARVAAGEMTWTPTYLSVSKGVLAGSTELHELKIAC